MSGTKKNAAKLPHKPRKPEIVTLTPARAAELLERNTLNRPLSQAHVARLVGQIAAGRWKLNGETIKIADDGAVLDGQHRLWAVVEADMPIETMIVHGVARDAMATIDTIRKPRSGGDTLALNGANRHHQLIATALTWLLRWQSGVIERYRAPANRIENSDIEAAYAAHPDMGRAVERAMKLRGLAPPALMGFLFYVIADRNADLAERMMATLENPAAVAINDPFFRLRCYFTADHLKRKDPLVTVALNIKAANAASMGEDVELLGWRRQGKRAEAFPSLDF